MKSIGVLFLVIGLLGPVSHAGNDGHGGAGVQQGSKYMTFYSAGLYTEPQPLTGTGSESSPGLNSLLTFVEKFPYWSAKDKTVLLRTVLPSQNHEYYKVQADQFPQATLNGVLAEYSKVTGQPLAGLTLFAVTDIEKRQTFLLPAFYSLSPADQVAILFHEALWLIWGHTSYQRVVDAEMAFEAVYEQPDNAERILDLLSKYGDQSFTLEVMAKADLDSGALNGLLSETASGGLFSKKSTKSTGKIPFAKILGQDSVNCSKTNSCVPGMVTVNIYRLVQQYPKSFILNRLLNSANKGQASVSSLDGTNPRRDSTSQRIDEIDSPHIGLLATEAYPPAQFMGLDLSKCDLDLNPGKVRQLECHDTKHFECEGGCTHPKESGDNVIWLYF